MLFMYKNVVTESSPDRNSQTKMSCDRNGSDWIGQTEKSCSGHDRCIWLPV